MKRCLLVCMAMVLILLLAGCSKSYTPLEYFEHYSDDEPLLLYNVTKIKKDAEIYGVYVIRDNRCRKYHCNTTLGELARMTDEEILEMLEEEYQDGLDEAIETWKSDSYTRKQIENGNVKVYEPQEFAIKSCLFTDKSGNEPDCQLLFFPKPGIGGSPYVIEYEEYSGDESFMNYHGTSPKSYSYYTEKIGFDTIYFCNGFGTESEINTINDIYCIDERSKETGEVYDSMYYGFDTVKNEWSEKGGILCFRADNAESLELGMDALNSSRIECVDPDEEELLSISYGYYNQYYNSFESLR